MGLATAVVVGVFTASVIDLSVFRKTMMDKRTAKLLAEACKRLDSLQEVTPLPPPGWTSQTGIFWADELPPAVAKKRVALEFRYIDAFIEFEILRPVFSYRTDVICGKPKAAPEVLLHVRKMAPSWPALQDERWSECLSEILGKTEIEWPDDIKAMDELMDRKRREYYQRFWSSLT